MDSRSIFLIDPGFIRGQIHELLLEKKSLGSSVDDEFLLIMQETGPFHGYSGTVAS